MSWLGTGLGAGVGMMLGGPLGAVLGGYLGHLATKGRPGHRRYSTAEQSQQLLFVSLFSMFAKLAKADGKVSSEEVSAVKSFMQRLRLDAEDQQAALSLFNTAQHTPHSIFECAAQYANIVTQTEMRIMTYRMLWELAMADKQLHREEERILQELTQELSIPESYFQVFKRELTGSASSLAQYYELLELSPESSDAEVKRRYHTLCKEYHPDAIHAKGMPKEFMNFATEHLKKINEAYSAIMNARKTHT